ncbi:MAG TPA: hypothetical protein PLX35_04155 [Cyclobacteriaceae bacterium]|nr:hypothetical protein [Cyclobacteriaceae bacterium]
MNRKIILLIAMELMIANQVLAQENHRYQKDFSKAELSERRARIATSIGISAIALIQGQPALPGSVCSDKRILSTTSPGLNRHMHICSSMEKITNPPFTCHTATKAPNVVKARCSQPKTQI